MSNILNSEDFGLKMYNRFPPKYREDDVGQKLALKRYLQALSDGGFRYIIQDTNGLLDIKDPSRTSLDILLNLYKQYGLEVFNGIPENYLRSLLPYLSSAWKYKGSIDIIEFVTTTLSGIKVSSEINYADSRTALFGDAVLGHALFDNKNSYETPIITVRLEMDFSLSDYFPSSEQFRRILENFVPFYCDLALVYSYVYSDENAIIFREFNIDHITDTKTESRNISRLGIVGSNNSIFNVGATFGNAKLANTDFKSPTEVSKDKVNIAMNESSSFIQSGSARFNTGATFGTSLFGFIPDHTKIKYAPVSDIQSVAGVDSKIDRLKDTNSEEQSLSRYGILHAKNCIFEIGKPMGVSVFGNEEFIAPTEVHKDKISTVVKDSINIHTMGSARFNDQTAKFNDFLLGLVPFEQTVKVSYTDSESVSFIESAESVISTMSEQNATFGHAVMTRARFNDKSFDKITVSY